MKHSITFINVGYGEAILLRDEQRDINVLIDAGSAENTEYEGSDSGRVRAHEYLSQMGLSHLNLVVATHIHEDHLCGLLPVVRRFKPKAFWHTLPHGFAQTAMRPVNAALAQNASQDKFIRALNDYIALCEMLNRAGCAMRSVCAGDEERLCEGFCLKVLAPEARRCNQLAEAMRGAYAEADEAAMLEKLSRLDAGMNNFSVILSIEFGGMKLLLPGDTNRDGYGGIDPAALKADLFKVGHHGQKDGASETLIEAVQPKAVVCCASSDRRYNSADPGLIAMIEAHGAKMYYSDCPDGRAPKHSALVFHLDGEGMLDGGYV